MKRKRSDLRCRRLRFETLEPRTVLSAAPTAFGLPSAEAAGSSTPILHILSVSLPAQMGVTATPGIVVGIRDVPGLEALLNRVAFLRPFDIPGWQSNQHDTGASRHSELLPLASDLRLARASKVEGGGDRTRLLSLSGKLDSGGQTPRASAFETFGDDEHKLADESKAENAAPTLEQITGLNHAELGDSKANEIDFGF